MESSRVAAIPFFADLPEDELAAVAGVASEVEIAPGQALAAEGRIGHTLFAIESGTADVVVEGATVRTIGAGDVVGEMAVLASPPDPFAAPEVAEGGLRTASVVATSPMRLIALFKRDVGRWSGERPSRLSACERCSMSVARKTLSARWPSSAHKPSRAGRRVPIRSQAAPEQRGREPNRHELVSDRDGYRPHS
jgi:CRP/FNR family transcriptional regulator, cyclic AMP receptor protein